MLIGKEWKIESSAENVTLSRKSMRKEKKTGEIKEKWTADGYFRTVQQALKELVNQEVRDTKLVDLKTVVDKIDELHKMIDEKITATP